jgi:energy-converting hydrogenase Eha subunit E
MSELVPLYSGALLGLLVGFVRPSQRVPVVAALSILLGIGASAVTGELSLTWEYVLVDIPLVAASATVGLAVARGIARRRGRLDSGAYG